MTTREEFVEKTKAKLDEWSAEIEQLEARARASTAEKRATVKKRVDQLRQQRESAKTKLGKVKEASADAWVELKAGCEKATHDLAEALKRAKAELTS